MDDAEERVRSVLEKQGELVNCVDTRCMLLGSTPLHHACGHGCDKVARVLLEYGATVDAREDNGWTPLHQAALFNHKQVARVLLEHGAEVNVQDESGSTPLHLAASCSHEGVVRLLLEHYADRSVKNNFRKTARELAQRRGNPDIVVLLDTLFVVTPQMTQVLLAMYGTTESPLTRFAKHSAFEPEVLSLVKCLLTGEENAAFEQLQREAE